MSRNLGSNEWRRVDADGKFLKLRLDNGFIVPHRSRPTDEQVQTLREINFGPNAVEKEDEWQ